MSDIIGTLTCTLTEAEFIVNDTSLQLAPIIDEETEEQVGYKITITKGSQVQTAELYGLTEEQLAAINEAESGRISAESARVLAEAARAAAETSRASAETARASAETARASAESARVSAESSRASAESTRSSHESSRVSAETSRVSAESARVSAESARVSAESARVTEYAGLKADAQSATGVANTAAASATSAASAANTATANTNAAITTANSAASNADAKATLANTAASEATAAASSATSAASSANSAASEATSAASSANSAASEANDAADAANTAAEAADEARLSIQDALALKADKTALAKTDRHVDILYKLTQGQAWDTEDDTTEAYSKAIPAGSHAVAVQMIGGKSDVQDGELVSADVTGAVFTDADDMQTGSFEIPAAVRTQYPLRSAGTAHDSYEYDEATGKWSYVQRVGSVVLNTMNWGVESDDGGFHRAEAYDQSIAYRWSTVNIITPNFTTTNYDTKTDNSIAIRSNNHRFRILSSTATTKQQFLDLMGDAVAYYELATPIITDITDLMPIDNLLECEAGGAATFEQTDTAFVVPNKLTYFIKLQEAI